MTRLTNLISAAVVATAALSAAPARACTLTTFVNDGGGVNIETYNGGDSVCLFYYGSYTVSGDQGTAISCDGASTSCKVQFPDYQNGSCPPLNLPCGYEIVIPDSNAPQDTYCVQPAGSKQCTIGASQTVSVVAANQTTSAGGPNARRLRGGGLALPLLQVVGSAHPPGKPLE